MRYLCCSKGRPSETRRAERATHASCKLHQSNAQSLWVAPLTAHSKGKTSNLHYTLAVRVPAASPAFILHPSLQFAWWVCTPSLFVFCYHSRLFCRDCRCACSSNFLIWQFRHSRRRHRHLLPQFHNRSHIAFDTGMAQFLRAA